MGGRWMSRLLVAEDKSKHIRIAPLGDPRCCRKQAHHCLEALFSATLGVVTALTAQTWDSGTGGECRGREMGRRGFHCPPAWPRGVSLRPIAWWRQKWTGGFCGPVTAWTLSSSFLSHLYPHLLPAGRRQAPAPVTGLQKQGVLAEAQGRLRQAEKRDFIWGSEKGQVLSQLALVRASM